ncbi:hypothetical protein RV14_GL000639 [Enterococcus ratti]|uniref:Helix-turn-helix type 11 domain-containing protein n=1 Tax=Enterococcus ratti TaxID=150033 RepID=A0A1L8WGU8_9ENTE|nr:hypothetical protein RV14_GL000639 [Enterococcus ratti]
MLKEKIQRYLENQTAFIDLTRLSEVFTANDLAEHFNVKRNTISNYLNQLNEEGVLVKINSRPAYYFHKAAFEYQFFALRKMYYATIKEILAEQPIFA